MDMLLMLLTLIAIILFTTFGQAFNSQCNNEYIFQYDSRGKRRAKEMLHGDQGNSYTNPLKPETNNSSISSNSLSQSHMMALHISSSILPQ
jgi:hypothetical protein